MKILIFIIFCFIYPITNAFAYLDPGSGSIILQMLLAFFALIATIVSTWWNYLKNKMNKIFLKKNKKPK